MSGRTTTSRPRGYAEGTTVPPEKTRAEIDVLLRRHGATEFAAGYLATREVVTFRLKDRLIRMTVETPTANDFHVDKGGRYIYSESRRENLAQAETRRRWRALLLILKAKLEAIQSGVVTLDEEFLPYIVLPSNQTVAEYLAPQIAHLSERGRMPPMLPGVGETEER